MKFVLSKLGFALVVTLSLLGLWWEEEKQDEKKPQVKEEQPTLASNDDLVKAGIEFKTAKPQTLTLALKKKAKLVIPPDQLVHVLPQSGGQALDATKNVGDSVTKGDVLAILSSKEMADFRADYLNALKADEQAEKRLNQEKILVEKRISSLNDLAEAEKKRGEAKVNLALTGQKLLLHGLNEADLKLLAKSELSDLKKYEIRSPINGVVLERDITPGENIDLNRPIYVIGDLSTLWAEIPLFSSEWALIKKGQPAIVSGEKSQVISLLPLMGEDSIRSKALANVPNKDGKQLVGSVVDVVIVLEESQVPLAVEKEAVQLIEMKPHVFIKTSEGIQKREVAIGKEDDQWVEIVSGLEPGEEYAAKKAFLIKADLGKGEVEDD